MLLQRLAAVPKRCHVVNGGGIVFAQQRFLGRYSRMMDLGGAPSSSTDHNNATTAPNLNKNCHLQYILFDFQVLCRSMQEQKDQATATNPAAASSSSSSSSGTAGSATAAAAPSSSIAPVRPDVDRVLQVAHLLKVDMAGRRQDLPLLEDDFDDDLSLLTNTTDGDAPTRDRHTKKPMSSLGGTAADLRLKYAEKLRQKTGGGGSVGTVDQAREERASGKGGDADFHLAARQRAIMQSSTATTSTRWMAGTGTGQLLSYLHGRGFKVVLLPTPVDKVTEQSVAPAHVAEAQSMDELVQQLQSKLSFHAVLHQDGTLTADRLFAQTPNDHPTVGWGADSNTTPDRCLCVSDRDILLKGAKEAGMLTLRIRPPSARRGNVSTNYTVETVTETQTIVNEINGISFRTVLRQQGY